MRFILERELGCSISSNEECPLVGEISDWIRKHVGDDYHWPGNIRELEQCVRNILFHGKYLPMQRTPNSTIRSFMDSVARGTLDLEKQKSAYVTLVFALTRHNYQKTALRLDIDRRTVKKLIDRKLLAEFDSDLGN